MEGGLHQLDQIEEKNENEGYFKISHSATIEASIGV
jgi:hypothetical protein